MEMEKAIIKFVEYLEKNFHKGINSYEIADITKVSYTKFSSIFKQIFGMKLKKYIKRRCLTKIIIEIKENKESMDSDNVLPYSSHQAFSEAFKNEFYIPPRKLLDIQKESMLCEKLNVDVLFNRYKENEVILDEVIKEYLGHKNRALNYLLSLNAYSITSFDENFSHPLGISYKALNRRYLDEEREWISLKSMSVDRYIEEIYILNKYYDMNTCLVFPPIHEWQILFNRKYYLVKRQLIDKLINNCCLSDILKVSKLKTIFVHFTNMNKLSAVSEIEEIVKYKYYYKDNEKCTLDKIERIILKYICLQDIGIKRYEEMDDLIRNMKMELDFDEAVVEKKIQRLIKSGLLYLLESDDIDYERELEKTFNKADKERLKEIEKQEKIFLKLLRKIKRYIISISVDRGITKVRYNYKALRYMNDKNIKNITYGFRYKNEKVEASYNIYIGLIKNDKYLEMKFNLSDKNWCDLEGKVKEDLKKKIFEIMRLIDKELVDEE